MSNQVLWDKAGEEPVEVQTQIQLKEVLLNGIRREPDTEDILEAPGGEPSMTG